MSTGRSSTSEVEDRRQRAREAAYDNASDSRFEDAVEAAIEAATRVQITPEIAAAANAPAPMHDGGAFRARAVLEAAGFEVVE